MQEFLLALLYTVAATFSEVNEHQKHFIRSIKNYLELVAPQVSINISSIENVENINSQKAILQTMMELLFLSYENHHYLEDYEEFFSYFSVNKRGVNDIKEKINVIHQATGLKGIAENYGYIPEEDPVEENSIKDEIDETDALMQSTDIYMAIASLAMKIVRASLDMELVLNVVDEEEIIEDINQNIIKNNQIIEYVNNLTSDDDTWIQALKYFDTEEYIMTFTAKGFFMHHNSDTIYTDYTNISSVEENADGLIIRLYSGYSIGDQDVYISDENYVQIKRDVENTTWLRYIRQAIKEVMEVCGQTFPSVECEIERIVEERIDKISKSSPTYIARDIMFDRKAEKKLVGALGKYAMKVRREEVIAFIDTSLFQNGKDGLLFSKDGIAFDYAFEKVFLKYEEMMKIEFGKKRKNLIFKGNFSERKSNYPIPEISNNYYNLDELKDCLEEILYLI